MMFDTSQISQNIEEININNGVYSDHTVVSVFWKSCKNKQAGYTSLHNTLLLKSKN